MSLRHGVALFVSLLGTSLLLTVVLWPKSRPRPNVVLVSVDTLRADHLGVYGYSRATSPFIDATGARGAVFDDVVTPMPATDPSHAAMLTGLHPMRTGLLANSMPLRPEFETIAEVFRAAGYATAAATGVYHLSQQYGFDRGFDRFTGVSVRTGIRRSADLVNADVLHMIQDYTATRSNRPLFLFVHYFDVHGPYVNHEKPESYPPGTVPEQAVSQAIQAYDSGIRFVDDHVREIWTALERAKLAGDTVIAITADHGEQLGEHGFTGGHADLYQETIRVPLVMAGPGIAKGHVRDTVSLMDLAPSLLELAGLRFARATEGRSVLPLLRSDRAGAGDERALLVLGYPTYARSLALRAGRLYFVRNLEAVYRSLSIGHIPSASAQNGAAMLDAELSVDGDRRIFSIPAIDFQPYRIVVDIRPHIGCTADVVVSIAPAVDLSEHLNVLGPTRLQYSLSRLDSSFVTVTPGSCVDRVMWRFQRLPTFFDAPAGASDPITVTTHLFQTLLTSRRNKSGDELFDVTRDHHMTENLVDSEDPSNVARLRAALEASFVSYGHRRGPVSFPPEEVKRLRSLGYIR